MKKLTSLLFITFVALVAHAQKLLPELKAGSTATLTVDYNGNPIDLGLTLRTVGEVINIDWDASGAGGTYAMKAKGLESGTQFSSGKPEVNGVNELTDSETFMCISKNAYQALVKDKKFTYGPLTFFAKDMPDGFKIGDKVIDALYAVTADGKTSLWILNSPEYPMTLEMKGNPAGVNYRVVSLK
ncbi:hypothetical protein [Mucilaginibacter myungsuensis]|uniref:Uncharacterized protein n=1 Tax=Mucilaginibacter myungsuensis TaxID=649104 RepID=A0A929KWA2_9SPHI|nr:hypothetical protein [Mucilaginibacter myungsuensis]MBE9662784.1 hypothetical protein [Mucilaginibacter myungsuensis]MDN3598204.1 hypothetical protein [Mucilaginibacter myungsuensis]